MALIVLLAGLTGSGLIYYTAHDEGDSALVSEFEQSKKFRHDLEETGGKGIVVASEVMKWLEGMWQGKSLAFTVAGISVLVSLGLLFFDGALHDTHLHDEADESCKTAGRQT